MIMTSDYRKFISDIVQRCFSYAVKTKKRHKRFIYWAEYCTNCLELVVIYAAVSHLHL